MRTPTTGRLAVAAAAASLVCLLASAATCRDYGDRPDSAVFVPYDFKLYAGSYGLSWDPELVCPKGEAVKIESKSAADTGLLKTPALVSGKPLFVALPLDGEGASGKLLIALDESRGTGKRIDRAYIDANRNGDLSDDEPLHVIEDAWTPSKWCTVQSHQGPLNAEHTSHPVQVRLRIEYRVEVFLSFRLPEGMREPGSYYVTLERKGAWKGRVGSNRGAVAFALLDSDQDGLYGEQYDYSGEHVVAGDAAVVSPYGWPTNLANDWGELSLRLSKLNCYGGRFYSIACSPIGNRVNIRPYPGPKGNLAVQVSAIAGMPGPCHYVAKAVTLHDRTNGPPFSLGLPSAGRVRVPAGRYSISAVRLSARPDVGDDYSIDCRLKPAEVRDIKPDSTAVIRIGGKTTLAIRSDKAKPVYKAGSRQGIKLDWRIGGNAVVDVSGLVITAQILDERGVVINSQYAGYT